MFDHNDLTMMLFILIIAMLGGAWFFLHTIVKRLRAISENVGADLLRMYRLMEDFDAASGRPTCKQSGLCELNNLEDHQTDQSL